MEGVIRCGHLEERRRRYFFSVKLYHVATHQNKMIGRESHNALL